MAARGRRHGESLKRTFSNELCNYRRTAKFLPMIPALILILAAVAYRIAAALLIHSGSTWLSNFAPLAAIALCGAAYFPARLKFSVPLGALFISDLFLNYYYGATLIDAHIFGRYLALILVGCLGLLLQNRASLKTLLPASVLGSAIFYLITKAFSWLCDPGYAKNVAGLKHSLTVGFHNINDLLTR